MLPGLAGGGVLELIVVSVLVGLGSPALAAGADGREPDGGGPSLLFVQPAMASKGTKRR
jgi:hypothetical protein